MILPDFDSKLASDTRRILNLRQFPAPSESLVDFATDFVDMHVRHLVSKQSKTVATKLLVFPNLKYTETEYIHFCYGVQARLSRFFAPGGSATMIPFHPESIRLFSPLHRVGKEDAPSNYTLRSPYPTIHLIRNRELDEEVRAWEALKGPVSTMYGNKTIPKITYDNHQRLAKVGSTRLATMLRACQEMGIASS